MQVAQAVLRHAADCRGELAVLAAIQPNLVLAFGTLGLLRGIAPVLSSIFPAARRVGCSTAGEISAHGVSEGTCVVTAIRFDSCSLSEVSTVLNGMDDSQAAGRRLALALPKDGLRAVLLFAPGVRINGSAVLRGVAEILGSALPITGGLAGDDALFQVTGILDETGVGTDSLVALGLYGESLIFAHGSFGGWSPFGPARKVTRSAGNVLYELDGEPALDVYKRYLGEHARDLPASGLFFPFSMLGQHKNEMGLIRTFHALDENEGSLTLSGDIDPDGYLKLMHANTDALISGAETAAESARAMCTAPRPGLVLLVSCFGRKLVMGERVEEEVDAVADIFEDEDVIAGFYSYGEISPCAAGEECSLHNQTMTITYISEA